MAKRFIPLTPRVGAKVVVHREEVLSPSFADERLEALERYGVRGLRQDRAAGGDLLSPTRIDRPGVRVIMARDPDGVRVELLQRPGPVGAFPGGEGYEMKQTGRTR